MKNKLMLGMTTAFMAFALTSCSVDIKNGTVWTKEVSVQSIVDNTKEVNPAEIYGKVTCHSVEEKKTGEKVEWEYTLVSKTGTDGKKSFELAAGQEIDDLGIAFALAFNVNMTVRDFALMAQEGSVEGSLTAYAGIGGKTKFELKGEDHLEANIIFNKEGVLLNMYSTDDVSTQTVTNTWVK